MESSDTQEEEDVEVEGLPGAAYRGFGRCFKCSKWHPLVITEVQGALGCHQYFLGCWMTTFPPQTAKATGPPAVPSSGLTARRITSSGLTLPGGTLTLAVRTVLCASENPSENPSGSRVLGLL